MLDTTSRLSHRSRHDLAPAAGLPRPPCLMNWRAFWDRDTPIYVSERHKVLHYARLASDIAALVPSPDAAVLDYGCGEALSADRIAARCGRLYLCDAAGTVRERLRA